MSKEILSLENLKKIEPHVVGAGCSTEIIWAGGFIITELAQVFGNTNLSERAAYLTVAGFSANIVIIFIHNFIEHRIRELEGKK